MKYILKIILVLFTMLLFCNFPYGYSSHDSECHAPMNCAENDPVDPLDAIDSIASEFGEGGNIEAEAAVETISITTTEKIPGIVCTATAQTPGPVIVDIEGEYKCEVPIGFQGALLVMGSMIRWLTGIAMICAVLFLVFNGIRLSTSGVDGEAKGKVKTQIMATIGGIILLLLSGPLLKLIAPWIYR